MISHRLYIYTYVVYKLTSRLFITVYRSYMYMVQTMNTILIHFMFVSIVFCLNMFFQESCFHVTEPMHLLSTIETSNGNLYFGNLFHHI